MKSTYAKVIVTGGTGFIGAHLSSALAVAGYAVHAFDNFVAGRRAVDKRVKVHEADVRDKGALKRVFKGANYVFHLAALPRVQFSIEKPLETSEVNIMGTMNMLIAARDAGVARVVYASSSSVYGDQKTLPLHEGLPATPKSPYAMQKYFGEVMCRTFSEVYKLPTVSLRYFNVYGPGLDPDGAYALVIGKFLKQRGMGKPMTITSDGKQTRDFTHVSDVVRANLLAMKSPKLGKGEALNIGAGHNVSVNTIAHLIGGPTAKIPPRVEPRHTLADIRLAKRMLGWKPSVRFEDGLAELKALFKIA